MGVTELRVFCVNSIANPVLQVLLNFFFNIFNLNL